MDKTAICNLALSAIGTRSTITSIDENSPEATALSTHYDAALEALLQAARWNFTRKQIAMTMLRDATQGQAVPTPWLYEYAYPSDCTQARFVMPTVQLSVPGTTVGTPSAISAVGAPVRFLIGVDEDEQGNDIVVILSNQPQATLVYTKRVTNPTLFDGQFVNAFAVYLGARVCMQLTGSKEMAMGLFKQANQLCDAAAASNGNEGITIIDSVPDWIKVRGYASDWGYPDGGYFQYGPQALTQIM